MKSSMKFIQSNGSTEIDLKLKQIWRRFIWRQVSFNFIWWTSNKLLLSNFHLWKTYNLIEMHGTVVVIRNIIVVVFRLWPFLEVVPKVRLNVCADDTNEAVTVRPGQLVPKPKACPISCSTMSCCVNKMSCETLMLQETEKFALVISRIKVTVKVARSIDPGNICKGWIKSLSIIVRVIA